MSSQQLPRPILTSVYLGVAEGRATLALEKVARKRDDADVWYLGRDGERVATGQMAVQG